MLGVERRGFLFSATIGMAMWNAIKSLLIGAATFGLLYAVGWWAWRTDPHMLSLLRESVPRLPARLHLLLRSAHARVTSICRPDSTNRALLAS